MQFLLDIFANSTVASIMEGLINYRDPNCSGRINFNYCLHYLKLDFSETHKHTDTCIHPPSAHKNHRCKKKKKRSPKGSESWLWCGQKSWSKSNDSHKALASCNSLKMSKCLWTAACVVFDCEDCWFLCNLWLFPNKHCPLIICWKSSASQINQLVKIQTNKKNK